ncbi:hypothetical protein V2G26_001054 [Clonostachys chloroleuca]|uniref:Disintegrin and metalloproteinase domain-containing protein B n=1 Tax=Clonostachys chloroleuca TaxID=1926264 RepID=A0AA35QAI7_9HYPO|nr:unnamed protein product [Clonostachys chloroleuca]
MIALRPIAVAIAGAALVFQTALGHSLQRNPVSYVSLVDEPVIDTPSHKVHSRSSFDLTFTLHNGDQPIRFVLEPNYDLLHDEFAITYVGSDGETRTTEPIPAESHRIYKGRAFVHRHGRSGWSHAGWARITVRQDGLRPVFEGAFRIDGDSHHIHTVSNYRKVKHQDDPEVTVSEESGERMVVFRDSDVIPDSDMELKKRGLETVSSCGADTLEFNSQYDANLRKRSLASISAASLFGRQTVDTGDDAGANYYSTIGQTKGCPTTRKVALVGIATDCNYWSAFDKDKDKVQEHVISMVNTASQLYEDTFNISLGIKNLTMIDQECASTASDQSPWNLGCSDGDLSKRLNLFSDWRGRYTDKNAYWTLLTTCATQSAVGLAWRGQLCREGSSQAKGSTGGNETIAATNVVVKTSAEWQVFAHETGHTFGAVHDCASSTCPVSTTTQSCCPFSSSTCDAGGKYIMNPSTESGITNFSPCSIGNICSGLLGTVDDECLSDNKDIGTFTGSQCGNGIVESGEDCDCGGEKGCTNNSCCDATTCKYKTNAVCDPDNERCCTSSCQFLSKGTVCRESTGQCDPEETCPGDAGDCPTDSHLKDGDGCGNGLHCASGQCTSRTEQCRTTLASSKISNSSIQSCAYDVCRISCTTGGDTCSIYNTNFLDGTDCAGKGKCKTGVCEGSSTWGRIQEWFEDHKNIAIPVGSVIGALLLLAIVSCIWSSCKRRRMRNGAAKRAAMSGANGAAAFTRGGHPSRPPGYGNYEPVPPIEERTWNRTHSSRYA